MILATMAQDFGPRTALLCTAPTSSRTFAELTREALDVASLIRQLGVAPGQTVAVLARNGPQFLALYWGCLHAGVYFTPLNTHLPRNEIAHVVNDCGAGLLVVDAAFGPVAAEIVGLTPGVRQRVAFNGAVAGHQDLASAVTAARIAHPSLHTAGAPVTGAGLMYSGGSTGLPRAYRVPLRTADTAGGTDSFVPYLVDAYGLTGETVALIPSPLYHAAPLGMSASVQAAGGTVVLMDGFDPEQALAAIERHRCTLALMVPTMFVRLLRLPAEVRDRYDISSLRTVVHGAAPCAVQTKLDMIAWLGPILLEYYSGTESAGMTQIGCADWLTHPGSVGRGVNKSIRVVTNGGRAAATGEEGLVYFGPPGAEPVVPGTGVDLAGWVELGDVGYLDDQGFLYLTDRQSHLIVSGGVNIYPQEIEDALLGHPWVVDVAVFGVPNAEWGEEVKAVVQLVPGAPPAEEAAPELSRWCRSMLAGYKCPRTFDMVDTLPRADTGKLYKRLLKAAYWGGHRSMVV